MNVAKNKLELNIVILIIIILTGLPRQKFVE